MKDPRIECFFLVLQQTGTMDGMQIAWRWHLGLLGQLIALARGRSEAPILQLHSKTACRDCRCSDVPSCSYVHDDISRFMWIGICVESISF